MQEQIRLKREARRRQAEEEVKAAQLTHERAVAAAASVSLPTTHTPAPVPSPAPAPAPAPAVSAAATRSLAPAPQASTPQSPSLGRRTATVSTAANTLVRQLLVFVLFRTCFLFFMFVIRLELPVVIFLSAFAFANIMIHEHFSTNCPQN